MPEDFRAPSGKRRGRAHASVGAALPLTLPRSPPCPAGSWELQFHFPFQEWFRCHRYSPASTRGDRGHHSLVQGHRSCTQERVQGQCRGWQENNPGLLMTYSTLFSPSMATAGPEIHGHQHPEPTFHCKSGALEYTPHCGTWAVIFGWGH